MPYKVEKGHGCPASRPWACINSADGTVHGCHATREDGLKQAAALYANTDNESKSLPDGGTAVDTPVLETGQSAGPSKDESARELVESVMRDLAGQAKPNDDLGDAEFLYAVTAQLREIQDSVAERSSNNADVKALLDQVTARNAEHIANVRKLAWRLSGGKVPARSAPAEPELPAEPSIGPLTESGLAAAEVVARPGERELLESVLYPETRSSLVAPRAMAASKSAGKTSGGSKPYGNVAYADPGYQKDGKARYPIDTAAHVKAAWSYINQSDNASAYTSEQLARIKSKIKAAAKKFGINISDNSKSRELPGFQIRSFDFETDLAGDGRTLEGYAAVFDSVSRISDWMGDFDEVIRPGAFVRSLATRTPVLQFEHGRDARVGAVPIGSIEDIREDARGLYVRARLYDNPVVEPVRQAIEGRSINGMSFRFSVPKGGDKWTPMDKRSDGISDADFREILHTDTREIGPVVFPAYDDTTVGVRALMAQLDPEERDALRRELVRDLADELERRGFGYLDVPIVGADLVADGFTPEAAIDAVSDTDLTGRSVQGADGGDSETESSSGRGSTYVDEFAERIDHLRFREIKMRHASAYKRAGESTEE